MDLVLQELNHISFQDLSLLCRLHKAHTINELANTLLSAQKANFSNSQIAFVKEALPDIVEQAWQRNDRFGKLSPKFMEALLNQIDQFDPKMSKQEKKNLKTALEKKYPEDTLKYMILFEIFTESLDRVWLISRYISGGILLIEDIDNRAKPAIIDFKKLAKQGYLSGNLSQFDTLSDLEAAVKPFLEKLVQIDKGQSNVVYEDSQFRVIKLQDQTAACYYGQGTQWCTSATKGLNAFDHYIQQSPVFVLLIKKPNYVGEKYQFRFFPEFFIASEKDYETELEEMEEKYSNIKQVLEQVYLNLMLEPEKIPFLNKSKITPNLILNINNGIYYLRNKWLVQYFTFVLSNDIKYIIGVKSNPHNLPELTTENINTFKDTDYTHLTFGYYFNEAVDNLPKNLTHLTFIKHFNKPVDHLPTNLTQLSLGDYFKQTVDHLPPNLTNLTFGKFFNQRVDHLPLNLTHLTFGTDFNQPIDRLPPNITHLTLGTSFNQALDKLPPNLKFLTISEKNKHKIPLNLPENVRVIITLDM